MAKRGRPRSTERYSNRRHTIALEERAERIFRQVSEGRKGTWFNDWVNDAFLRDFGTPERVLQIQMQILERQRKVIEDDMYRIAEQLKKERAQKKITGRQITEEANRVLNGLLQVV